MSAYTWPSDLQPASMQLRVVPRTLAFTSPYSGQVQVVDMMGDYWHMKMDWPGGTDPLVGGRLEAFFDRLKGQANQATLWNFKRPTPLGTVRGTLVLYADATAGTNSAQISGCSPSTGTLLAGDMLAINQQLVRVLADATASGGIITVEFAPRLRATQTAGTSVTWNTPTAPFILVSDGAPVLWTPGEFAGPSAEFRESF